MPESHLYRFALLGSPSSTQAAELRDAVQEAISGFGLSLGGEVGWDVCPDEFKPAQRQSSAVIYFGGGQDSTARAGGNPS